MEWSCWSRPDVLRLDGLDLFKAARPTFDVTCVHTSEVNIHPKGHTLQ